jgi:hypothetical protein
MCGKKRGKQRKGGCEEREAEEGGCGRLLGMAFSWGSKRVV